MNAISQRNKLEVQLKNYKDFVPICPSDALLNLMFEMAKVHLRIEKIKEQADTKLTEEVSFYYDTKQSKSNFKTL